MLHNRIAIIFLLTRRASTYGLGVSSGISDDDINGNTLNKVNCYKCKLNNQGSPFTTLIPFTPYHNLMLNYNHRLSEYNPTTSNSSFHSSAPPVASQPKLNTRPMMPESVEKMAIRNAANSVMQKLKSKSSIKIQDTSRVENLLSTIISGGNKNLQVVIDFDYTMTRVHKNGQRLDCSWGVMENSNLLPESYTKQTNDLRAKYLPIEQDASMTAAEKTPFMVEWYTKANLLLSECGTVKRHMFQDMIGASNVELREGTEKMMNHLLKNNVPVLVLSAGLGDLVEEILRYYKVYHSNVKVVSNFLDYDEEGNIVGLAGDVIHVFNKNEKSLKPVERTNSEHVENVDLINQIHQRGNVLLMGDSLGDPCMADGIENPSAVLKIGFLNHNIETDQEIIRLSKYMDAYDVVLVDDQTTDVFNLILDAIDGINV